LDKSEYQEYLASREWAEKKEAVKKRAAYICERCGRRPIQATHHLTYERVGNEDLEDLQGVCRNCHAYLSARSDYDPAEGDLHALHVWCCRSIRDWPGSVSIDLKNPTHSAIYETLKYFSREYLDTKETLEPRFGVLPYGYKLSIWGGARIISQYDQKSNLVACEADLSSFLTLEVGAAETVLLPTGEYKVRDLTEDSLREYWKKSAEENKEEQVAEMHGVGGA